MSRPAATPAPGLYLEHMEEAAFFLLFLVMAVACLSAFARPLGMPYPILLVIGGLALGLLPGIPKLELEPDIVLLLFLPPLLYSAAFFSSLRDLRADMRVISLLALGLALATTVVVAAVAQALIPGLPWPAAFALGAIVSPTDPVAATAVMRRLGAPRRVVTIIEGESLINDASAIVVYRIAVAATIGSGVRWWEAGLRLPLTILGGVVIGVAVGWLVAEIRRRVDDPPIETAITLITGYAAYLPAERLGVSGVLAAVAAGLLVGWRAPEIASARSRLVSFSVWEIVVFLANALLFILIGLQLPLVLGGLAGQGVGRAVAYAAAVTATVVAVRLLFQFTTPYLIRALDRRPSQVARRAAWQPRLVIAWSGMRGAVSLAVALALPLETNSGAPFPQRGLIIFITFGVIFFTLVLQGLSLPWLLRRLSVQDDGEEQREEVHARLATADAALARIDEIARRDGVRVETIERLRALYEFRRHRFAVRAGEKPDDGTDDRSLAYQRTVRDILTAQRNTLVRLRDQGMISNDVMHRVERELDLEDSRLEI